MAQIQDSLIFACPNGHPITLIDGQKVPLPYQECMAYCAMSNELNDKDWLRCKECNYKVCWNCTHCGYGHELDVAKVEGQPQDCSSCGNNLESYFFVCT